MRAVAVTEFGAEPQVMDLPQPEPGPGEVLVRVAVAALNPLDWKIADGMLRDAMPHAFPLVLGVDGAGEVVAVGPGADRYALGDRVFGQFMRLGAGGGSYADFAATAEEAVAPAPSRATLMTAAALPTAGMTAWNLVEEAGVREGDRVLIVGATGGVGTFATQFAAGRGAEVIVTARPGAAVLMCDLGAAETIDHSHGRIAEQVLSAHPEGVDIVIDLVHDASALTDLARIVRSGGTVASTIGAADAAALELHGVRALNAQNSPSSALLSTLATELDEGRLTVLIGHETTLEEAPAALAASRSGRARGKTVIRV
ncbi:NADP-dependent oxidoreductase [Streptomyces varsoviensis]|uniref:Molecular chaperone GroES n=1 Tax=Streptomyces varsoviensis TaxID=67373 RepID=A0ABR5J3A0_9ACTN|nr:NADP-dependent oxidoreductase [Streptomyces varsoviensis]KOG87882.1 molecular chaperone GroES [Streptomyces varsoviensis]